MKSNVLNFEPKKSIFVSDKNPLIFYKRIFDISKLKLKAGGLLYLEINPKFKSLLISLSKKYNFSKYELKKDIYRRNRYIKFQKMNPEEQIKSLRNKLHNYNNSYYNKDESLISDFEFDMLLKQLERLEKKYPQYYDENSPHLEWRGGY